MKKILFLYKVLNYLREAFIYFLEAYAFNDKLTIIKYYLKTPLFLTDYFKGKPHSRTLSKDVMIKNKYGLFFCGRNLSSVSGFSSISEPKVRKNFVLKKGIVVDIGSNCGMYTIPLGKMLGKNGKVISIEPEKENIKILKKNISLNNLKNVTLIEKGCFSKKGKMEFYLDPVGSGGHSLVKDLKGGKVIIPIEILDNILNEQGIKKVDFLKIDVEGAEADVLKGAIKTLKKSHPKIIFEAWDKNHLNKIKKILDNFDYKIKKIAEENYLAY